MLVYVSFEGQIFTQIVSPLQNLEKKCVSLTKKHVIWVVRYCLLTTLHVITLVILILTGVDVLILKVIYKHYKY